MTQRVDFNRVAPEALKALSNLNRYIEGGAIAPPLRLLIDIRISQINGCSFCIDLHMQEAREAGESQQRLDCLPVWHEVPFFSEAEKAALAWAEAVTLVSQTHVPEEVFAEVKKHFTEAEIVDITMVAISVNAWNRLAISFRKLPAARGAIGNHENTPAS